MRQVLTAGGLDEAMTASVVAGARSDAFSPWTNAPPLAANTPMLEGADRLRRSLVPSLLDARRINESLSNPTIELFETARIYLPVPPRDDTANRRAEAPLPRPTTHPRRSQRPELSASKRRRRIAARALHINQPLALSPLEQELLAAGRAAN